MLLVFAQNQMPVENQAQGTYCTCIGANGAELLTEEEADALPGRNLSYADACDEADGGETYVKTENGWELVTTDPDTHSYHFRAEWAGGSWAESFDSGDWDDNTNGGLDGVSDAIETFKGQHPDVDEASLSLTTTNRATGEKSTSHMTWRRAETGCTWE